MVRAARSALGGQTANVVATLKGTVNPELVYVVSSHYDSVAVGPGADDDTSGTAALLEAARILARHPQPATIVFASFTGEEAGLLGSREFVRRAVADKVQDRRRAQQRHDRLGQRSSARQHHPLFEPRHPRHPARRGDAVQQPDHLRRALLQEHRRRTPTTKPTATSSAASARIRCSASPHYHQPHDVLETINHQLVTEVAKTTAATLMLLASSPSRLTGLKVDSYQNGTAALSWTPSPEKGVTGYIVAWGPDGEAGIAAGARDAACGVSEGRARDDRVGEGGESAWPGRLGLGANGDPVTHSSGSRPA